MRQFIIELLARITVELVERLTMQEYYPVSGRSRKELGIKHRIFERRDGEPYHGKHRFARLYKMERVKGT
jgi:Mor family transcriptional regulator